MLRARFPHMETEENFSFARHTTIGCGGTTAVAVCPTTEELPALLRFLQTEKIGYCFLGAGANVLAADGEYDGVVVRFSNMNTICSDGELLFVGAGVTGGRLCRYAREHAIGGLEPFTGIPMTVGGGIVMNAGVREGHFADVVRAVLAVENGELRTLCRADCNFSEKESVFQNGIAVVGAVLQGKKSFPDEIERRTCYFRGKRAHLPHGRSMGCVFVNPNGESAGKLVDSCGLKGLRCGGAFVSERHANFIVNEGGAAQDVAALIDTVKREVFRKTGVKLREEIRRLP